MVDSHLKLLKLQTVIQNFNLAIFVSPPTRILDKSVVDLLTYHLHTSPHGQHLALF